MFATVESIEESTHPLAGDKFYVLRALAEMRGDRDRQNAIECRIDSEKPETLVSSCCVKANARQTGRCR
ncbi:hypothetical protein [Schlesneria sp. DSM 10557]|uniref:hypothetical protein n=1 Tax=Schlesneria sp. DSM 10557 TaxID=3044399 RepID=UPI0035A146C9